LAVVARPGPLLPRSRVLSPAMAQWPTVGVRAAVWADVGLWRASTAVTVWITTSTAQIAATPPTCAPWTRWCRAGPRPGRLARHERADAEQPDVGRTPLRLGDGEC